MTELEKQMAEALRNYLVDDRNAREGCGMSAGKHTPDWYERRHELESGMVFQSIYGIVKLEARTPGDGTKWDVANWWDGSWSHMGGEIEPGDLEGEPIEDSPAAIAKATGQEGGA